MSQFVNNGDDFDGNKATGVRVKVKMENDTRERTTRKKNLRGKECMTAITAPVAPLDVEGSKQQEVERIRFKRHPEGFKEHS